MVVPKVIEFCLKVLMHRPLFKNYYSSALAYALYMLKLIKNRDVSIKCFDNSEMRINLHVIGSVIYSYLIDRINSIDCRNGILRTINGSLIPIDEYLVGSDGIGYALRNDWVYDFTNKYWFKDSIKFKHIYGPIVEIFDEEPYGFVDVGGRVVVDVGGFVGDSAIYFVLRGAERVYAIEPHPGAYQEMLENIKLNNMQDKIIPINAALGSKPGKMKIPSTSIESTIGTYHKLRNTGDIEITIITLGQLIDDYNIKPDILKMDCEGCEFDVILNDYESIKKFYEIVFEYHTYNTNYNILELINILNKDFKCKFINEAHYKKRFKKYTRRELGMLYCYKTKSEF